MHHLFSLGSPVNGLLFQSTDRYEGCMRWTPLLILSALVCASPASGADSNWSAYLGDKGATHFSTLRQITPENVGSLQPAWTFNTGGMPPNNRSQIQCNPLVINGVLFGTTPDQQAFAIEAATGKELWRFDPAAQVGIKKSGVNRGLMFWEDQANPSDRRIFLRQ